MKNSTQKTARQTSIDNGEQIVITLMAYFVLFAAGTLILRIMSGQMPAIVDIIRFILALVASIYLYKGENWAKLFLTFSAILAVFSCLRAVFLIVNSSVPSIFNLILFLILMILNLMAAYYLIFSSDVDEFLKSRKV